MRSTSLQSRFTALFVVSTAICSLSLGGISLWLTVRHLKAVQLANLSELAQVAALEVRHAVEDKQQLLLQIAGSRHVLDYPINFRMPPLADHLVEHKDDFPDILFIDPQGVSVLQLDAGVLAEETVDYTSDVELRRALIRPGEVLVQWRPDRRSLVFTLAVKRYFGDVLAGCLRAELQLPQMIGHLADLRIGETGYIGIETAEGRLLRFDGKAMRLVTVQGDNRFGGREPGEMVVGGAAVYASRSTTGVSGLQVLTVLPRDEFMAGPRQLAVMVGGMAMLLLAVGACGAYLFGGRVSRPLFRLIGRLEGMTCGQREEIVVTRAPGEIADLVSAYNKLVRALKKTTVSRDYLDNIFESMLESLIVVNMDGQIERVNRATCELLGYEPDELQGQPVTQVIATDEHDGWGWLEQVTKTSGHFRERSYRQRDGRIVTVAFSWTRLLGADGTTNGLICLAQRQDPGSLPSEWRQRLRVASGRL